MRRVRFILIFVAIFYFLAKLDTISQIPSNLYSLDFDFRYPYFLYDTCNSYLDHLFKIPSVPVGTNFEQIGFKPKVPKKAQNRKNFAEEDTITEKNRVVIKENERGDVIIVTLYLENADQNIKIYVYNLLGKKVLDVFEGKPKSNETVYEIDKNRLPKGVFLLVVIGQTFRIREKIVVAR